MEEIRTELRQLREQQNSLINSVTFCSEKVSDFESKLIKIDEYIKKTEKLQAENTSLKKELSQLKLKVNDLDQISRLNNIELQGIPEKQNENLGEVLQKIGDYVNYKVDLSKVEYIHRVQLNKNSNNKIRNIIVRFVNRREKENLLTAAKTKRLQRENGSPKMSVGGVSEALFINEHLTMDNKLLFRDTRLLAKRMHYKYVWTKNGDIFLRKDDSSKIIHVRNSDTLQNIK
nr:unnamed protein product [Callosobruchus chinensis]